MPLGSQLPVRLEPEIEEKLEKVAAHIGMSKSALIRILARSFVEQMVKPNGSVELPPQWSSVAPPVGKRSSAKKSDLTVQECSELLMKAARKEKAKERKQEQKPLRPLAEQLERVKEMQDKFEARMKADSEERKKYLC